MNQAVRNEQTSDYKRAALIAAVLFASYAYFYAAGGFNQNSRFDLVRSIVDQHTLRIDSYHENTGDKAVFQGHYYSDKAPGTVLLAVPVVAAVRPLLRWAGMETNSARGLVAESYFATILVIGLPAALAGACLFLLALRLGSTFGGAAFASLSLGLATPVWAWATIFFGHALAGACLLLAYAVAVRLGHETRATGDLLWGLAVGIAAGWATVTEYPAAPASVMLAILALAQAWRRGPASRWCLVCGIAAGASACLAILLGYQYAAFGSPFQLGYTHYDATAFPWMNRGFLGLRFPRVDVMFKLLFGFRIGLFLLAPVTAAAVFGLRLLWKQKDTHALAVGAAAIAVYYWLFNASFSGWHAGWTYGPRYMGAGIPMLCVGLAPLWTQAGKRLRLLLCGLAVWGTSLSLMAVAVTAQPPENLRVPVLQLLWPSFWAGRLSINRISMLTAADEAGGPPHGSFNLGELASLHGLVSLLPLLTVWAVAFLLWRRMSKKRDVERAQTAIEFS